MKTLPLLLLTAALIAGSAGAQTRAEQANTAALDRFQIAVDEYAELHRRLERNFEPVVVTNDVQAIVRGIDAMAAAVRSARSSAREGDLFTPELRRLLRVRISEALAAHGLTAEGVLEDTMADSTGGGKMALPVNSAFPWLHAAAVPPCVIDALPELPPELEYRMVGPHIVLLDAHASMIVDVFRHALEPELTR